MIEDGVDSPEQFFQLCFVYILLSNIGRYQYSWLSALKEEDFNSVISSWRHFTGQHPGKPQLELLASTMKDWTIGSPNITLVISVQCFQSSNDTPAPTQTMRIVISRSCDFSHALFIYKKDFNTTIRLPGLSLDQKFAEP